MMLELIDSCLKIADSQNSQELVCVKLCNITIYKVVYVVSSV